MYEKEQNVIFSEGIYTEICLEFIRYKHGLGQKFQGSVIYRLRDICEQLNQEAINFPILTREMAEKLASRRSKETQGTQINRICVLRQFTQFMLSMGFEAYIYPKHNTPKYKYDFKPYIFSHEQLLSIVKAFDLIRSNPNSPKAHIIYPAMIRVLCGCGLRSAEVRKLKTQNVDLNEGVLVIKKSKNNISRNVPMSITLTSYLKKYVQEMNILQNEQGYFFPAPDGGYFNDTTLEDRCKKAFEMAGISRLSNGKYPRLHDLRHSHIVHSFSKLTKVNGLDMYTAVPLIAAYVGHTNLLDTERYLHLPEFDYSDIVKAGQSIIVSAIPEVIFDE
jgi:integrase/recombinase XerD